MNLSSLLDHLGNWSTDAFTAIDLIAASTNAFYAAILVTRPDHRRNWTPFGIILLAILGGIGGIILRDVLLTEIPSALTNSLYLVLCFLAAVLALAIIRRTEPVQIALLLEFMIAFSLPWYAIVGAQKSLAAGIPLVGVVFISVAGSTAGRYLIDIISGVTPKHFTHGEWFLGSAALAAGLYIVLDALGLSVWPATLVAWFIVFTFRYAALRFKWEKPEPWNQPLEQP
jgi:uncharacterized membrane protein YeiH